MAQATQPSSPGPVKKKEFALPWWVESWGTVAALGLFGIYSLWLVFFQTTGRFDNYLSPFFSPDLGIHVVPALFVVWAPLLFRATCYYYRKEYYRGFFHDPAGCAIPERGAGKRKYTGETRFPFNLNNLHRWFWYLAVIVLIILWKDAIQAFFFSNGFGVGLGSLIMLANVVLLTMYTFSCHAWRHLIGGGRDCFTCPANPNRPTGVYGLYRLVSSWNTRHGWWAWISMFSVWATDVYIRLLISGALHPVRFF